MRELGFDPYFEARFWLFIPRPGFDVLTHGVDEASVPVAGCLCVQFDDAALQFGMPPHLFCLDGSEVLIVHFFIFNLILYSFHDL